MSQNSAGDLQAAGLYCEKFTVTLTDNSATTVCAIPTGKRCMGVVLLKVICEDGYYVESYAVSMTSSTVTITPQFTSNKSGQGEVLVCFQK